MSLFRMRGRPANLVTSVVDQSPGKRDRTAAVNAVAIKAGNSWLGALAGLGVPCAQRRQYRRSARPGVL